MKCCGEERRTPFCAICGKKLGPADPLEGLLAELLDRHDAAKRRVGYGKSQGMSVRRNSLEAFTREEEKLAGWVNRVKESLTERSSQANICADYLEERGMEEAAGVLRRAFECEVPVFVEPDVWGTTKEEEEE